MLEANMPVMYKNNTFLFEENYSFVPLIILIFYFEKTK